jgi:deazaflavin-dependent oxidoreductase (nitroreductase family)
MSGEADNLFGQEHVERYRETGGEVGHEWRGATTLILTTTGNKSGEQRSTPLIYREHDGDHLVVASKGGSDQPPTWFVNLEADPSAEIQVMADRFPVRARVASPEERAEMWPLMNEQWPDYDSYQENTEREIPIVVLERT